jgi:hypothetical protein
MAKIRSPWVHMDYDTDKLFLRTTGVADGTIVLELPESFPIGQDDPLLTDNML